MTWVVAVAGLGALVFIHELGHFLTSLVLGMRPRRFYVGFPPPIWKTTRGGIEYGIGAIPLGGMVKIPGMHRPSSVDVDHAFGRAALEAPELGGDVRRLRNALVADDHDAARDALGVLRSRLEEQSFTPAVERGVTRGATDLEDALGKDAYWRAATWKRVLVIAAGPLANILLAIALFTGLFLTSGGQVTGTVGAVDPGKPAAAMGLRPGDRIVAIDHVPVKADEIRTTVASSKGRRLTLTVERDGRRLDLPPGAARLTNGSYLLGIALRLDGNTPGVGESAGDALRVTWAVTREIGASLGRLVQGEGRKDISSPVGIVKGSSQAAKEGASTFFWVLGLISLSIALLNLLPLLPLDGGHIAFSLIEGVRGRSVRREIYERVSVVGIALVLLLFFLGLSNDVGGNL